MADGAERRTARTYGMSKSENHSLERAGGAGDPEAAMEETRKERILVIGVGGGGSNAVDRMIQVGIDGVEYVAANTDAQALRLSEAPLTVNLGPKAVEGLGVGGQPELGAIAAEESQEVLARAMEGAHVVFVACGLGGGTGTGASPLIAELARSQGSLTVAVVTLPFAFEGGRRRGIAEEGLAKLRQVADATVAIPNDRLVQLIDDGTSLDVAFRIADDVLRQGVQGITELVTKTGLINLDLNHIRALMQAAGRVLFSIGQGRGEDKAVSAAEAAISSPLTDIRSVAGSTGALVNVVGGPDLTLPEVKDAVEVVGRAMAPDAEIIFGAGLDPNMAGQAQVTLIAVGMPESGAVPQPVPVFRKSADRPKAPDWVVGAPEESDSSPFSVESDLDVPAFIRRRRRAWKET
ncbi:MAG: cell division protein FtsZ [Anaerolineae bacterium]